MTHPLGPATTLATAIPRSGSNTAWSGRQMAWRISASSRWSKSPPATKVGGSAMGGLNTFYRCGCKRTSATAGGRATAAVATGSTPVRATRTGGSPARCCNAISRHSLWAPKCSMPLLTPSRAMPAPASISAAAFTWCANFSCCGRPAAASAIATTTGFRITHKSEI